MPPSPSDATRGALLGLGAAVSFGVSAPISKVLLGSVAPLVLAGLLYLGGGLALAVVGALRSRTSEAGLRRADVLPLIGVTALGGIGGPLLMLVGLQRTSAVFGSLLLNLEAPFTIGLALVVFREHLGRRELGAAALIVLGAAVLGVQPGGGSIDPWGVAALAGACLCWGLDNNLTQRLSLRDPVALVRTKALGAGTCSLVVATAIGQPLPDARAVGQALVLGAVSYGVSIVLDAYALRLVGAAREAAFFATAPFIGALAAVPIAGDRLGPVELGAGVIMGTGVALLIRERHRHAHVHEATEHDHAHVHDEHHRHEHVGEIVEPHSHPHRHAVLVHDHPHVSDLHHRHRHEPGGG